MTAAFLAGAQRLALLAIATLLPLIAIAQGQLHYDHKAYVNRQIMEGLYVDTIQCLRGSTLALLRQGVTERDAVMTFNLKTCGKPLYRHLIGPMGWDRRDAAGFLLSLNDRTVASISHAL